MPNLFSLDGFIPKTPASGAYWIAPNATVLGKVELGEMTSIWFQALLRGDTELIKIGEGSNVQDGSILHTDAGYPLIIGTNCTIGHGAIVHGCSIGNNCLVGMGATILNGSTIGDDCLIGAGSLITENKKIPDGHLVLGSPAKTLRPLTPQEIIFITQSASAYQNNMQRFQKSFKALN